MAEKVSGSDLASRKSSDYNTEIRTKLGARLKAHYEACRMSPCLITSLISLIA